MARINRELLLNRISWDAIDPNALEHLIYIAKNEDLNGYGLKTQPVAPGDCTTLAVHVTSSNQAHIVARSPLVLCGVNLIATVIKVFDPSVTFIPHKKDGDLLQATDTIGVLQGHAASILQFERILLNFIQHLSGIATNTHKYLQVLGTTSTALLDTRKTTPGFRYLEKYAVACAGAYNHRLGLFDRLVIKDNHLAAAHAEEGEALANFLMKIRHSHPTQILEVEVDSMEQIKYVLSAQPDIILLDNFKPDAAKQAVQLINQACFTEASGGINLNNISLYANIGLDFISTGALVHHSSWADIALDW